MKPRFQLRYLTTTLLLVVASLLLVALGIEIDWGRRISLPLPQPKLQDTKLVLAPLQPEFGLPPLDPTYAAMLERPLFVPTRRPPPPPPPVVPPKPAMRKGQFILVGVILTKEKKIAFLREIANGKVLRVEEGKEINGILVSSMEKEKIILKQWDDQEELVLKIQPMPKMPPTAQVPPMAPGQPGVPAATLPGAPIGTQDIVTQRRALRGLPP